MFPLHSQSKRSPLRSVTNTANSPMSKRAGSTPVKKPPLNPQTGHGPRISLQPLPSDSTEKGSEKQKKPRASLNKRVSFGGNSINVFYKQSEFSPQENEPALKIPRTFSRSSPLPQRSPRFSRPDTRILPASEEDESEDTLSMPSAPELPENSYFPDRDPSPPVNENPSPMVAPRESIGFHDRQSFGLFVDEDVTMGERDIVRDDQEDMTIEFPRLSSAPRARRVSNSSVLSDGDITQQIYGFIPKLLDEEDFGDNQDSTEGVNKQLLSSPRSLPGATGDDVEAPTSGSARGEQLESAVSQDVRKLDSNEMDIEGQPSCVSAPSGEELVPSTQQATGEHPMELASVSPGVKEPVESSDYPSPAGSVRVRPVPPNCRKLFDFDGNEDEDTTLHYHDEPTRSSDVPGSVQRKPLQILSAVPSTPLSATQSRLRSAIEERASASGKRKPESTLRELSNSAARSAKAGTNAAEVENIPESCFTFRDFLQAVQLNFDRKAETRQRGQSLAPQNFETDNFHRNSFEGEILESVRKASVLETFRHQIEIYRQRNAETKDNLRVLESQLEAAQTPIFKKMAEVESMAIQETATYRVNMKRLRKLCTLKNKEAWVTGRQTWEKDLTGKLKAALAALSQDEISLSESLEEHRVANSLFVEQVAGRGVGSAFTNDNSKRDSTEEDIKERRAFIQEMSIYRDHRCFVDSLRQEEEDLNTRKQSAAPLQKSLLATSRELREKGNANSEKSTRKRIIEQMELNSIVSGVTGVNLMRINKNSISLRALDMMDIQFSLHDDKVINTSCKTVTASHKMSCPVWQPYVDGCVNLVNWKGGMKSVKFVRDIPFALFQCASALRRARLVYEDAVFFLDQNMGRLIEGGLRRDKEDPTLYLTVEASFYSLTLRSKFDVTVTVRTCLPTDGSASLKQEVALDKIQRYFGDKPDDQHISRVLLESGRREDSVYSLSDGLSGVSGLLG